MRKILSITAACTALVLAGPVMAQSLPRAPVQPTPNQPNLTPQVQEQIRDQLQQQLRPCRVDPAITRIVLRKNGAPDRVQVSVVVTNRGSSAWIANTGQAVVTWQVRNGNTGQVQGGSANLNRTARAGAVMLSNTSPVYSNAFDTFEFSGTVTASLAYDPDIAIDGNSCNDDINMGNNTRTITSAQISAFMASRNAVQVFNF